MSMSVNNNNSSSVFLQNMLRGNTKNLNRSMEMLASGYRINRASDDAAGLQVSESLRSQIRGSQQDLANIEDGSSVLNIADGATQTMTENLQRVRELAVQGANDTLNVDQRNAINKEMNQLVAGMDQIAASTEFNGQKLFGTATNSFSIQTGTGTNASTNTLNLGTQGALGNLNGSSLGIATAGVATLGVSTGASALASISKIDNAMTQLGNRRSAIGSLSNRLSSASANVGVAYENFAASESRIRNADIAKEASNFARHSILQQASVSMLGYANSQNSYAALGMQNQPRRVMGLLK